MAKKRNSSGNEYIAIALIIVALILYGPLKDLAFNNQFFNLSLSTPTNQLPPALDTCSDYNLDLEFIRYFGAANMQTLASGCTNNGGDWTSEPNEVSCHFPNNINLDCTQPSLRYFKELCDQMKATYVCSNTTKFVGCLCNVGAPDSPLDGYPPNPDDDNDGDQDGYTCAWNTIAGMCFGTCPEGLVCDQTAAMTCACIDPSGQQQDAGIGTVFVTSMKWNGALGGLAGADAKCQIAAENANLPGIWRAIMSDTSTDAISRLPDVPYYNMGGLIVANSKADLFDGSIMNFINIDENGVNVGSDEVWTGTTLAGKYVAPGDLTLDCHDWGWTSDGYFGTIGNTGATNLAWIENTVVRECKNGARLYCAKVN